jgi:hypothetical protein
VIPSVAYTDPEVAWVGLTEDQAKAEGIKVKKGHFPWTASGRAIANGRDEGFTKLLFDAETHRILGGGIVGTHAGDMIGEIALAIEMGADEIDIGKTIHPHPTLGESIGMAAEVAHGTCTDLPPAKKALIDPRRYRAPIKKSRRGGIFFVVLNPGFRGRDQLPVRALATAAALTLVGTRRQARGGRRRSGVASSCRSCLRHEPGRRSGGNG